MGHGRTDTMEASKLTLYCVDSLLFMQLNIWPTDRGIRPLSAYFSGPPVIVNVFPEPVWPYAKTVPLNPSRALFTAGNPTSSNTCMRMMLLEELICLIYLCKALWDNAPFAANLKISCMPQNLHNGMPIDDRCLQPSIDSNMQYRRMTNLLLCTVCTQNGIKFELVLLF